MARDDHATIMPLLPHSRVKSECRNANLATIEESNFTMIQNSVGHGASRTRKPKEARSTGRALRFCAAYCPIICFALSGVIAVVATVTVVGTLSAQSSRIDFAMLIASGAPVG